MFVYRAFPSSLVNVCVCVCVCVCMCVVCVCVCVLCVCVCACVCVCVCVCTRVRVPTTPFVNIFILSPKIRGLLQCMHQYAANGHEIWTIVALMRC